MTRLAALALVLGVFAALFLGLSPGIAQTPDCSNGVAVTDPTNNAGLVADCEALLAAKDTLEGTATLDWSDSTSMSSWTGLTIEYVFPGVGVPGIPPRRVTWLIVSSKGLNGTIPSALSDLSALQALYLSDNQLTGTIPAQLGTMSSLTRLILGNNQLTGTIPSELGDLSNLELLGLEDNQLSGSMPTNLGNLTDLQTLQLQNNELTGSIPAQLGSLSNLTFLNLSNNRLDGSIPAQLGSLTELGTLNLKQNQLTGSIPSELGDLSNLLGMNLSENMLSGSIPGELGKLSNLIALLFQENQLTGSIPSKLGDLSNLTQMFLWKNMLTGSIPSKLGDLSNLTHLWLYENMLTGSIPTDLGNLSNLVELQLQTNKLTGSLPSQLGSLSKLRILQAYDNALSGTIPSQLGSISTLEWLLVHSNELTGPIPSSLGSLRNLEYLTLSSNGLTGTIPSQLGSLSNLLWLYLDNNKLTGDIPSSLGKLSMLRRVSLAGNDFTGCIPTPLRSVGLSDLDDVTVPFCDVLLSGLSISPGTLTPRFGAYVTNYFASTTATEVTVTPSNAHSATFEFLDSSGTTLDDDNDGVSGHQVDVAGGAMILTVKVVSQDRQAENLYTIQMKAPGAPTITTPLSAGSTWLTVVWTEPTQAGGSTITSYDLRYKEDTATDWTLVEDVWTTGSGDLTHQISNLAPATEYNIQVRGLNGATGPWSASASATPTANDAPQFPSTETGERAVAENTAAGMNFGRPVEADDHENDELTYTLGGPDALSFDIVDDSGQLKTRAALNHEDEDSYSITVSVHDGKDLDGNTDLTADDTIDVTVTVTDVDEPPTVSGDAAVDYAENRIGGVATYEATDPEDDMVIWSLAGTDAGDFTIADGVVSFRQTPNYEAPADSDRGNEYLVVVRAWDGSSYGTRDVVVTVTDVDEAPAVSGQTDIGFEENRTGQVARYTATDPEEEDLTWSLAGTDAGDFTIADGVLTFGEVPDRERPVDFNRDNVYLVTVRAWDENSYGTRDVVVTVTDVDEAPVISVVIGGGVIDPVSGEVSRDYAEDLTDPVGLFLASDPEGSAVTLSLADKDDADSFELSGSGPSGSCVSGSCELWFGELPDFESPADSGGNNVYEVTVRAGDGNSYGTRDVVVTVTNVDEDGTVSLSSVQPQVGTELGAVLSDPDGSVTAVGWVWERSLSSAGGWSPIVAATEDAYTPVDGDEDYFLRVTASYSDGQGSDRKSAEGVSANRVQEAPPEPNTAPYFPSSETGRREVDENTPAGEPVGDPVAALDDNAGDTLTYRLDGGTDAAAFEIDELSGQLLTEAALDYDEGKRSYSMTLVVTDTSGEDDSIRVRVVVTNVDEPPDLSGPVAVDYAENRRDMVASYRAVDPEEVTIVWTLAGDDADDFAISRGVLTFGSPPDYEAPTDLGEDNTYEVTVEASDRTYTPTPTQQVTVRVTNLDEDGTVTLTTTTSRPQVGTAVEAALEDPDGVIGTIAWGWARSTNRRDWTPIDGTGTASYTPTSDDVGHYLQATATYDDREGSTKVASAHTAGTVVDPTRPRPPPPPPPPSPPPPGPSSGPGPGPSGGGGPEPLPPGANHPPEFGEGSRTMRMVAENSPAGTDIGGPVTAVDPEGDPLAYKLAGTAAESFDLDSATGQLKTKAALDYESRNSYTISVEVRDGKNPEGEPDRRRDDSIRVTIMVGNRNDAGWVTLSAPTPRVDQPLEAVLSDPDGDIADLSWRWERSTDRNTWTPIPDTTTNTYTPTPGDADHHLRVTATYSDPFGPGQAATTAPPNPVTVGHTTTFTDVDPEGVHAPAIEALAADGIFVDTECGEGLFCPDQPIQRSTMAIWLIRILGDHPPVVGVSRFDDIAHGQWWIRYAEQLADRNITLGCATNPPRYCPDRSVTRAQMASFLTRALQLPPAPTPAGFTDTEGNTHQANIDALAAAGITLGCDTDPLRYCPDQPVTRAQMATFLHRALNHQSQRPPTTNT